MRRTYGQYCATARTLDLIGERWTLLVIRELLTGPKRFKDLRASLPGLGTGLLTERLRYLEEHGLVERTTLPPPADLPAYDLTAAGRDLEPAVMALARWGLTYALGQPREGEAFHPGWAVLGLQASFRPELAQDVNETYELRVGDETFHAEVRGGSVDSRHGAAFHPDLTISINQDSLVDIAAGRLTFTDAAKTDRLQFTGPRAALSRFERLFSLPQQRALSPSLASPRRPRARSDVHLRQP